MLGFYNVIKPTGASSGLVVNQVKHLTKEKVGHLGTLDPLAGGVLPIAVGKATRLFDYFLKKDKEYFAIMRLGVSTTTLDSEGEIDARGESDISLEQLRAAAKGLVGEIMQTPPIYSAIQVGGRHAYDLAKDKSELELSARKTQIYSINVEKWGQNGLFALKIHCAAGTYVRSIVRDIAAACGTVATTVCIIRTRSGAFDIRDACLIEEIKADPAAHLIRINDILHLAPLDLDPAAAKDLRDGKRPTTTAADGEYLAFVGGKEFALVAVEGGKLKSKIYFFEEE